MVLEKSGVTLIIQRKNQGFREPLILLPNGTDAGRNRLSAKFQSNPPLVGMSFADGQTKAKDGLQETRGWAGYSLLSGNKRVQKVVEFRLCHRNAQNNTNQQVKKK